MAYLKNPPPKLVAQDQSKFHCWAASLESWIDARKPATPQAAMTNKQAELVTSYKEFTGANDGLMVGKAMIQVMFDFQMMLDLHKPKTKKITLAQIQQRLMMKSYLWLLYLGGPDLGPFLGHCVVVYGTVDIPEPSLRVMDPWTGMLEVQPLTTFNEPDTVFVCWYETGPNWSNDMFSIMKAMSAAKGR
jgi:hypothetical protein